ncbi:hypothetical protein ACFL0M_07225 [Thermodesulfobacteriota bacterium]
MTAAAACLRQEGINPFDAFLAVALNTGFLRFAAIPNRRLSAAFFSHDDFVLHPARQHRKEGNVAVDTYDEIVVVFRMQEITGSRLNYSKLIVNK